MKGGAPLTTGFLNKNLENLAFSATFWVFVKLGPPEQPSLWKWGNPRSVRVSKLRGVG